jgi:hypothetical protein
LKSISRSASGTVRAKTVNKMKLWFYKTSFAILAFLLSCCMACATLTPEFKIAYAGVEPVKTEAVNPHQIDLAWALACQLAGIDPEEAAQKYQITMAFEAEPVEWMGHLYFGLSSMENSRVWFQPRCLFDENSAVLHEFMHIALWIKNGDADRGHRADRWPLVDKVRAFVEERICPVGGSEKLQDFRQQKFADTVLMFTLLENY